MTLKQLSNLDRRIIFLGVAIVALVPFLFPLQMPVTVTPEVKSIHDKIESLPERAPFLLSMDFDPGSAPELLPMAKSLLRHAFRKNLRVIGVTLWNTAEGLMVEAFNEISLEMERQGIQRENGKDWCVLGFQPGQYVVVIGMGQSLKGTYPEDKFGKPTAELEVLKGVNSLRDMAYHVELAAGEPGVGAWYFYGKERFDYEMGIGCTSIAAPEWYPFLQTKQLNGIMGGMRGAAEYEKLIKMPEKATFAMDPLSTISLLIIVLVAIGNVTYFLMKRAAK